MDSNIESFKYQTNDNVFTKYILGQKAQKKTVLIFLAVLLIILLVLLLVLQSVTINRLRTITPAVCSETTTSASSTGDNRQYTSCQDVRDRQPNSLSGYYHVNDKVIYCEIGELCGSKGGWTRLAYLNMSDSTVDCPPGFGLYDNDTQGERACGRPVGGAGCASVQFPSDGISYSEVCGRVVGYQYGSTDGVDTRFAPISTHNNINSYYVDGVSITRGFPRKHIWTLIAGFSDTYHTNANCPCNVPHPGSNQRLQSFIGNNYFCESGNHLSYDQSKVYTSDPLWDDKGCGSQEGQCCAAPGLPWFYRTLDSTTDYLELRVCADEPTTNEDVPIGFYEIYVK